VEWYSLDVVATTGPDWLAIDPALRGHWHALVAVCAQRENSGVLRGARAWSERNWDRLAGLTVPDLVALERENLVRWDGDDLAVIGYDMEREQRAQATRERQRATAEARWEKERRRASTTGNAMAAPAAGSTAPIDAPADAMAEAPAPAAAVPAAVQIRIDKKRIDQTREEPRKSVRDPMVDFNAGKPAVRRAVALVNRLLSTSYDEDQPFHTVNTVRGVVEKHGEPDTLAAIEWKVANWRGGKPTLDYLLGPKLMNIVADWKARRNGPAAPGGRQDFPVNGDNHL
jgi:hypothetical protein